MTVQSSISPTHAHYRFAEELVDAGRSSSVSAVLQQGIEVMRQRVHDEDLQRAAQKALLDPDHANHACVVRREDIVRIANDAAWALAHMDQVALIEADVNEGAESRCVGL